MSCLGVLFSIDGSEAEKLKKMERGNIVEYIQEEIEEVYFNEKQEQTAELDKAWDAIHRAFCESELLFQHGEQPFSFIILDGEILYGDMDDEDDYIVSYKNAEQVKSVSEALKNLSESEFREKYFKIDEAKYEYPLSEDDFEYSWGWLSSTFEFWHNAAKNNLSVIFTVDQ